MAIQCGLCRIWLETLRQVFSLRCSNTITLITIKSRKNKSLSLFISDGKEKNHKSPNTQHIPVIALKLKTKTLPYGREKPPKDADRIADRTDPDQTPTLGANLI